MCKNVYLVTGDCLLDWKAFFKIKNCFYLSFTLCFFTIFTHSAIKWSCSEIFCCCSDPLFVKTWANIGGCEVSACEKAACYNNAECEPNYAELDHFECKCENGYHGKTCKEKLPYCRGDPCNGGICIQSSSRRQCLCQYGKFEAGCLVGKCKQWWIL